MPLPVITIEGRAVEDPTLRFTQKGEAVASFRVAASDRYKNDAGEWEDRAKLFLSVTVWGQHGENVAETITKGMEVVVVGKLYQDEYEDKEGQKRTAYKVTAYTVSPSLRRVSAKIQRVERAESSTDWTTPIAETEEPPF